MKKIITKFLGLMLIIGCLAYIQSYAATYYVRPSGDCPNNGDGTAYTPAAAPSEGTVKITSATITAQRIY